MTKRSGGLTRDLWAPATWITAARIGAANTTSLGLLAVRKAVRPVTGRNLKGNSSSTPTRTARGSAPQAGGFAITAPYSLKHWVGFFSAGFYLE